MFNICEMGARRGEGEAAKLQSTWSGFCDSEIGQQFSKPVMNQTGTPPHIFSHQGCSPPPHLFPSISSGFNSQHFGGPVTVHISTIITCIKHFSNVALTCITWMLNMSIWKYTLGWRHFVWKGRDMIVILVGNQNYFLTYPQIFTKNLVMFIWNNDDIFIFLKENIKTWSIFWLLSLI